MIATIADYSFLKMHVFFLNRDERIHFQKDSFWHLLSRQWKLSCFFTKKQKPEASDESIVYLQKKILIKYS